MEIVPSAAAGPLSTVAKACELVVYGGRLAIVRAPQGGGGQPVSIPLAVYDTQSRKFTHDFVDPDTNVLAFKGAYVLEPDVESGTMLGTLGPPSTDELFFDGETPFVVIHVHAGNGWRILNLTSGQTQTDAAGNRPCFTRWRLGIRDASGTPRWLIEIK
jgi:hypothetical protein